MAGLERWVSLRQFRAIARRCPRPTTHHATRHVYRATDDRAHLADAAVAAPVPLISTVRRSAPNGHASALSEISRACPECYQDSLHPFMRLVLGSIVQAILTPLLVFLLPGPGSILQKKAATKPPLQPWQPALFISAALSCAAAIPVACWYALRQYAALHNTCGLLFDLGRPIDVFHVDYFSDFSHYFIYSSVFSAFWVGITAGGLR